MARKRGGLDVPSAYFLFWLPIFKVLYLLNENSKLSYIFIFVFLVTIAFK